MAELRQPCDVKEATYCMNGGTCYKISSMNTLTCVCSVNYKGSRCELLHLFTSSSMAQQAGIIAAIVIVVIFILVMLGVVIYFTHKMIKAKRDKQSKKEPYWKVPSRNDVLP
ncbi:pro-neuregulin-4, membrane-bound isoform [Gouania willdenowi]|uniref:EGF-like domain-containing protein n=1 Tax=Gouania willdenowi TaxID=441366 RepID=A0A8C5GHP6_GOUWI|nr:pro-neuregulin-4, membrane-bound isoform [Gouania willdenowi]